MANLTKIVVDRGMGSTTGIIVLSGLAIGGGLLAWFGIVRPAGVWLGLLPSPELKKARRKVKRMMRKEGVDPNFYKDHLNKVTISTGQATTLATRLSPEYNEQIVKDNISYSPTANIAEGLQAGAQKASANIKSALNQIRTQVNLSKVIDIGQKLGKLNISTWTEVDEGGAIMATEIADTIIKMPKY